MKILILALLLISGTAVAQQRPFLVTWERDKVANIYTCHYSDGTILHSRQFCPLNR